MGGGILERLIQGFVADGFSGQQAAIPRCGEDYDDGRDWQAHRSGNAQWTLSTVHIHADRTLTLKLVSRNPTYGCVNRIYTSRQCKKPL